MKTCSDLWRDFQYLITAEDSREGFSWYSAPSPFHSRWLRAVKFLVWYLVSVGFALAAALWL